MGQEKFNKSAVVLDTSLFVNPEVRESFGRTPTEALESFPVFSIADSSP